MDELLKYWRAAYDDMQIDGAETREAIAALQVALAEIEKPYLERMAEIEKDIKTEALVGGTSVKAYGVAVGYRGGYQRVSYDSKMVDVVRDTLRDLLPETANALDKARKASFVSASVSIKAME